MTIEYVATFAKGAKGECNTGFYDAENKLVKVKLIDGVVVMPKFENEGKKLEFTKLLTANGFEGVYRDDKTPVNPKVDPVDGDIVYSLLHPDHSEQSPFNNEFILDKGGLFSKKVTINVVNGVVKTQQKKVADALIEKGFSLTSAKPKE